MSTKPDPRTAFIKHFSEFITDAGMSPIARRIFATLHYDGTVRSLNSLAQELSVSRASISTNARKLIEMGFLEHLRQTGDRQDYYKIHDDAFSSLLSKIHQHLSQMTELLHYIEKNQTDAARISRLKHFVDFHVALTQVIHDFTDRKSLNDGP
ncbi:hypothetical protein SAMN06273572_1011093 [Monaibacterium marinum]|uniref:MarR family protein n=1 Tax=Pontivivens marinum TaxID=1690039 RepID=A0A2C9CPU2_9RHOB|nr:hypothetical protein [Monaibacterium marinum]SOH93237.1 hypothetical protein SAMN06273572_1011093 [Monaibacterium marinum]